MGAARHAVARRRRRRWRSPRSRKGSRPTWTDCGSPAPPPGPPSTPAIEEFEEGELFVAGWMAIEQVGPRGVSRGRRLRVRRSAARPLVGALAWHEPPKIAAFAAGMAGRRHDGLEALPRRGRLRRAPGRSEATPGAAGPGRRPEKGGRRAEARRHAEARRNLSEPT